MSTLTDDPRLKQLEDTEHEIHSMESFLNGLREGYGPTKYASEVKQLPEVKELIEKAVKTLRKEAPFLKLAELKARTAKITRETELAIRKIANEKPERQEVTEESSSVVEKKGPTKESAFETKKTDISAKKEVNKKLPATDTPQKELNPLFTTKTAANTIPRGGNADRVRESKPDRPTLIKSNKAAVNTKLPTGAPAKPIPVLKKSPPPAPKPTAKKPTTPEKPKIVIPKIIIPAPQKNDKTQKEKTKASKLDIHKLVPYTVPATYGEGDEVADYDEMEVIDRGPAITGNTNTESYTPPPTHEPRRSYSTPPDDDSAPAQTGDDGGNGNDNGKRKRRSNRKRGAGLMKNLKRARMAIQIGSKAVAFFATPPGWFVLGAIGVVLLVIIIIALLDAVFQDDQQNKNAIETLTIRKEKINPPTLEAKAGEIVTFNIIVTDTQPSQEIMIIDHLPAGVSLIESDVTSSWTKRVFNPAQKTITWKASENISATSLSAPNFTITVKYKVITNQINLVTWAEANPLRGAFSGQNIPPSNNDCHGMYRSYMNMLARINKANYGDPNCELVKQDPNGKWFIDKDTIFSFMWEKPDGPRLSKTEAEGVFLCIMPKECSGNYNVNAYNPNSTSAQSRGTPGAFGCFQMNAQGHSNTNQPEDVGDVVWQLQIHNANNWRKKYNNGRWRNYWPESYSGCLTKYGL